MRANRTSGSMRRGEKRVMVHSANGHRTRKGGNGGAPPGLYTTALAFHSTAGPQRVEIGGEAQRLLRGQPTDAGDPGRALCSRGSRQQENGECRGQKVPSSHLVLPPP